jgi:flagellar biosynthetic protein FliR
VLGDILQLNIFAFIMVFARIGTALLIMPGFASMQVYARARLSIALAISFLATPALVAQMPSMPNEPMMIFLLLGSEILTGAILGTIPLILLSAAHVAGTIISFVSGLASALTWDPVVQTQSGIVSGFLGTVGLLLVFVTDMHHVFIRAILDSYTVFQPGVAPDIGDTTQMIARQISQMFLIGVQMSTPFIVLNFAYNVGLGIMTRLAPQVPIFFVAMPLQLIASLAAMMITTAGIMLALMNYLGEGMRPFVNQ